MQRLGAVPDGFAVTLFYKVISHAANFRSDLVRYLHFDRSFSMISGFGVFLNLLYLLYHIWAHISIDILYKSMGTYLCILYVYIYLYLWYNKQ